MILSDNGIRHAMDCGDIKIDPFDPACLVPNSYDVHLSPHIVTYPLRHLALDGAGLIYGLDCKHEDKTDMTEHPFNADGSMILHPGWLYLASTLEYTETHKHVPYLDGKSSIGRLGIFAHVTAGRGDIGFCGHWTLEIVVVHPVRVYAGMPIGQLTYHVTQSPPDRAYGERGGAAYNNRDPRPQPSRMWKNFR